MGGVASAGGAATSATGRREGRRAGGAVTSGR